MTAAAVLVVFSGDKSNSANSRARQGITVYDEYYKETGLFHRPAKSYVSVSYAKSHLTLAITRERREGRKEERNLCKVGRDRNFSKVSRSRRINRRSENVVVISVQRELTAGQQV